jgi:hypothetical protein
VSQLSVRGMLVTMDDHPAMPALYIRAWAWLTSRGNRRNWKAWRCSHNIHDCGCTLLDSIAEARVYCYACGRVSRLKEDPATGKYVDA